tara:strand:+ start:802 stop:1251 length:450 start_codon:yes stop_codon:yes gene_type:complete
LIPPSEPGKQPSAPLPTKALLVGQFAAGCIAAVLWSLGTILGGFGSSLLVEGLIEIGLVTGVVLACTLAIAPWTVRPAGTWAVVLIATSLVRLVVITGLTLLLYSAARMAPKALVVSAFVTIATVLIAETLVTTRFLSRLSSERKATLP